MTTIASQIISLTNVSQPFIQTQIKENIKAPRNWPLCGEFTGAGDFPAQRAINAENVSIWWRHHENSAVLLKRGQLPLISSQQTNHSLAFRASYVVSVLGFKSDLCSAAVKGVLSVKSQ